MYSRLTLRRRPSLPPLRSPPPSPPPPPATADRSPATGSRRARFYARVFFARAVFCFGFYLWGLIGDWWRRGARRGSVSRRTTDDSGARVRRQRRGGGGQWRTTPHHTAACPRLPWSRTASLCSRARGRSGPLTMARPLPRLPRAALQVRTEVRSGQVRSVVARGQLTGQGGVVFENSQHRAAGCDFEDGSEYWVAGLTICLHDGFQTVFNVILCQTFAVRGQISL